jgi:hypothetical protein
LLYESKDFDLLLLFWYIKKGSETVCGWLQLMPGFRPNRVGKLGAGCAIEHDLTVSSHNERIWRIKTGFKRN